jgi:hypothetical protein
MRTSFRRRARWLNNAGVSSDADSLSRRRTPAQESLYAIQTSRRGWACRTARWETAGRARGRLLHRELRPVTCGRSPGGTAMRTSLRTSIPSDTSESLTVGHRKAPFAACGRILQALREVEGLVGCKSRGGSSPLRRTRGDTASWVFPEIGRLLGGARVNPLTVTRRRLWITRAHWAARGPSCPPQSHQQAPAGARVRLPRNRPRRTPRGWRA